jgi:hypothetical protein
MTVKMSWFGDKASAALHEGAREGLQAAADELLRLSQPEVPVSPYAGGGFLRSTGATAVDPVGAEAAVFYNGPADTPGLPVFVHERMDVSHTTGHAKFLEGPLNANKPRLMQIVADHMSKKL